MGECYWREENVPFNCVRSAMYSARVRRMDKKHFFSTDVVLWFPTMFASSWLEKAYKISKGWYWVHLTTKLLDILLFGKTNLVLC